MTKAKERTYRQRLVALKKRLGSELSELEEEALRPVGGDPGDIIEAPVDPGDMSTSLYEEEVALGLLENESQLLAEVNDALARLDRGTYGRCENCGREISQRRLEALPYARYCILCARQLQDQASG